MSRLPHCLKQAGIFVKTYRGQRVGLSTLWPDWQMRPFACELRMSHPQCGEIGLCTGMPRSPKVVCCRFRTWRLPNEHLRHFDRDSLVAPLAHSGFECVTLNRFEVGIRLQPGEAGANILSVFFRKV